MEVSFFDRDLSWLSFNERVLEEAARDDVPLLERIRFLGIFSSNLDEFYRVRMPVMLWKSAGREEEAIVARAQELIAGQLTLFGTILRGSLLPALRLQQVHLLYNEALPGAIHSRLREKFLISIAAYLTVSFPEAANTAVFVENNHIYQVVVYQTPGDDTEQLAIVHIPSDELPRFYTVMEGEVQYIVFLEDIIRLNIASLLPGKEIQGVYNIKATRDAELELDELALELDVQLEESLARRDLGNATRLLYEPGIPLRLLHQLSSLLRLTRATLVEGGKYHNMRDLATLPVQHPGTQYPSWPPHQVLIQDASLLEEIMQRDILVNTPYQSYDTVLRFFNEAAIDPAVTEVAVTLYRIASDSRIAHALITAAKNGKKVLVFVELKARFDEANNIRWGKRMKEAGIRIIYSIPGLKVHAKVALVKKQVGDRMVSLGLFSTGNLNESTARFYTDHILLSVHADMVRELDMLFVFLAQKRKPLQANEINFQYLLVAQFNLQEAFFQLIDAEIEKARAGMPSGITIKLNNLEEKKLIRRLYAAAEAGVPVHLIVRSICCLQPAANPSQTLTVTRIVDRYLEHGRVFIFHNGGEEKIYLGSSDWMNRNIYSRVEVCFPIFDAGLRLLLLRMISLQLADNVQAIRLGPNLENLPVTEVGEPIRSQSSIYQLLSQQANPGSS